MLVDKVDFSIIRRYADSPYVGSIFADYKNLGAKRKGAVSERFIQDMFKTLGHEVEADSHTNHDFKLDGQNVELKSSTLNAPAYKKFSFLQIRPKQSRLEDPVNGYDYYMFAAILPNDLRIFRYETETIYKLIEEGKIKPQHGGKAGDSGTFSYYATLEELETLGKEITQ